MGFAGALEVFGGVFTVLGLLTRPVGFALALLYMVLQICPAGNGAGPASAARMIRARSNET